MERERAARSPNVPDERMHSRSARSDVRDARTECDAHRWRRASATSSATFAESARERERKEDYGKESWLMGQCVLLHLVRQTRIHIEQVELVGQHRSH